MRGATFRIHVNRDEIENVNLSGANDTIAIAIIREVIPSDVVRGFGSAVSYPHIKAVDEEDLDLTHVRSVELHYLMNLEDLSILDRCKDLRSLTIEFCNVKKFERLQEFERLEEVYLWTSGPAKVLPHIKNHRIKKLRYNFISWDAEEIELLCQFKHLETLDLGDYWTLSEEHAVKLKTRLPHVKISYKPESAGYHQ